MALYRKSEPYKPKPTPFGGFIDGVPAVTGPHLLVSGPSGVGKALALSTLIPTPTGFTTMADIAVGDQVFGRDGEPTTVTDVWDVIQRPELYRLRFSTGHDLRADAGHQWTVVDPNRDDGTEIVVTTVNMVADRDAKWIINPPVLPGAVAPVIGPIHIVDIERIEPGHPDYEAARCIAVDAPDAVFLAGSGFIPTHNSRRVLGPGVITWGGPVVAISSKPDLIELCLEARHRNAHGSRTYVLDLSGQVPDDVLPEGVEKVVIDPVALIGSADEALDLVSVLMKAGAAGASSSASGQSGDPFWENISIAPLAGILRAAGADGIAWAKAAVGRPDPPAVENPDDGPDTVTPCWINAIQRLEELGEDQLSDELLSAHGTDSKMRDSVMITMKSAIAPWWRSTVVGGRGERVFAPDMLEHPASTLFVVAPAGSIEAGAAVAAVDSISAHWRRGQTRPKQLEHLLIACDELCNTFPWTKLPIVVTEARAMGIAVLAAVQSTSQFARRYGREGMDELRDVFPSILVLCGAPEKEIMEKAAWAHGRTERQKQSVDHAGRGSSSGEISEVFHGSDLVPKDIDHGRLLRGSRPADADKPQVREAGLLVELVDISRLF
ncbi:TraM recognition domain-containing protein [Gordonia sp. VNK1]|uniref:TraM recognition domain-containing protein n=1 Tax=Gordonia oleivorans TaxID=3156618 RepID=UPI0032B47F7D